MQKTHRAKAVVVVGGMWKMLLTTDGYDRPYVERAGAAGRIGGGLFVQKVVKAIE